MPYTHDPTVIQPEQQADMVRATKITLWTPHDASGTPQHDQYRVVVLYDRFNTTTGARATISDGADITGYNPADLTVGLGPYISDLPLDTTETLGAHLKRVIYQALQDQGVVPTGGTLG